MPSNPGRDSRGTRQRDHRPNDPADRTGGGSAASARRPSIGFPAIHGVNDRVEENRGAPRLKLSIVVPAFNEEAYLGPTLDSLRIAAEALCSRTGVEVETIVVDNNSRDRTASIARDRGATVVPEPVQLIARAPERRGAPGERGRAGLCGCGCDRPAGVPNPDPRGNERSGVHRRGCGYGLAGAAPLGEALPGRVAAPRPAHRNGAGRRAVRSPGRV